MIGAAAVHIVCADLLLAGYTAFPAAEGLHYDVILDNGGVLYRVQVKGTLLARSRPSRPLAPALYNFGTTRNHRPDRIGERSRLKRYDTREVDLIACVAIDIRTVAYFRVVGPFIGALHLYPPGTTPWVRDGIAQRRRIDEFPIAQALDRDHLGATEIRRITWVPA